MTATEIDLHAVANNVDRLLDMRHIAWALPGIEAALDGEDYLVARKLLGELSVVVSDADRMLDDIEYLLASERVKPFRQAARQVQLPLVAEAEVRGEDPH
jgi:hypothetical protein